MKKIYTLLATAFLAINAFAQNFTTTSYRGAFAPAPAAAWTNNWTNWDPQSVSYPSTNTTVSTDITSNTTWTTGTVVLLQNKVYVTNNAVLTIQPGVIIRGDKATEGTLIISRGAQIMAQGSASNPIVFTSNFAAGSRAPGDWGGLVLLGSAVNNQPGGTAVVEGGLDTLKAQYGGTNDLDNSGVLSYVRIEFAGFPFQPDKEINGLTFGSVGSATTVNNIQVSFANDDAFEWFGGTVNCYNLVAYCTVDDNFDSDNGYRGHCQFLLSVREPSLADQCTCSTSEGFESDNNAGGTAATPITGAIFSNVTDIGPYRGSTSSTIDAKFKRALRIRRNSSISIFNSVFTDWPTGLHIDGTSSEANAIASTLVFKNNVLAGMSANTQLNAGSTFDITNFFSSNANVSYTNGSDVQLTNPYDFSINDFRPQSTSPLASGADFSHPFLAVGIKDVSNTIFATLSPNPAKDQVTLSLSLVNPGKLVIQLFDLSGKQISRPFDEEKFVMGSGNIVYPISDLSAGVYMVRLVSQESLKTLKLVVSE
jgi:hypothetical protein